MTAHLEEPKDAWVLEGLAERLREAYLRKHLGGHEAIGDYLASVCARAL